MSAEITKGRFTAGFNGPITVFVIGMRINRLFRPDKWLPVVRAMGPMLSELSAAPGSGFLAAEPMLRSWRTIAVMQYWRDFDSLEAYARNRDQHHWPAWTAFNRSIGKSGAVGIFHETYVVPAGGYETIYVNMPSTGLGKIAGVRPATGSRVKARSRMRTDHAPASGDTPE